MGQSLVFHQNRTDLTKIALGPKKPNAFLETLDRLLAAAADQSYPINFLLLGFDHFPEIRKQYTIAATRAMIRTLLGILMEKTPDEFFVTCSAVNEYLLVLPRLETDETLRIARDLQRFLEPTSAPTISIAGTSFPHDAHSRVAILSQLRETLAALQAQGTGQVAWWHPVTSEKVTHSITPALWERFMQMSERVGIPPNALVQEALEDAIIKYNNQ